MLLLVPLAVAGAMQPILIGQAISLIRQEPNTYEFQGSLFVRGAKYPGRLVAITVVVRLVVGTSGISGAEGRAKITADIRNDLFDHVTSLAVRFFDRTPGRLITASRVMWKRWGCIYHRGDWHISDLFSMLVIVSLCFFPAVTSFDTGIDAVSGNWVISSSSTAKRITKLGKNSLLSTQRCKKTSLGLMWCSCFAGSNSMPSCRSTNQHYIREVDKTIFTTQPFQQH